MEIEAASFALRENSPKTSRRVEHITGRPIGIQANRTVLAKEVPEPSNEGGKLADDGDSAPHGSPSCPH